LSTDTGAIFLTDADANETREILAWRCKQSSFPDSLETGTSFAYIVFVA
jgi:hypothetical protein